MAIPPSTHTDPAERRAVNRLLERGALFAVSHSGGKDSQAMTLELARFVPPEQMIVIHAPLGEVEWPGTLAHIEATIPAGVPLLLAPTASGKTLLERIEERGKFPDPSRRWCTSDHYGELTIMIVELSRVPRRSAVPAVTTMFLHKLQVNTVMSERFVAR